MRHLMQEHPYACDQAFGHDHQYQSWQQFLDETVLDDVDLNLVFRFDVQGKEDEDGYSIAGQYQVCLYCMEQRRGRFVSYTIDVSADDEAAVTEWLATRWRQMQELWTPFSGETNETR
jgi:hypothetical protein